MQETAVRTLNQKWVSHLGERSSIKMNGEYTEHATGAFMVVLPLASDSEDKPRRYYCHPKYLNWGQSKKNYKQMHLSGKGKHNMQRHGFKNSWVSTALVNHKKHKSNSKLQNVLCSDTWERTTSQPESDTQGSLLFGCSPGGTGRSDVPVNVPLDVSWFLWGSSPTFSSRDFYPCISF